LKKPTYYTSSPYSIRSTYYTQLSLLLDEDVVVVEAVVVSKELLL
jgi:hypothetical protein